MFKNVQISGSFGPTVVVKSGSRRAINIAGGSGSGDVYKEVAAENVEDPFAKVHRQIRDLGLTPERMQDLDNVVNLVAEQVEQGEAADSALVEIILARLRESAPEILKPLVHAIIERTSSTCLRQLALDLTTPPA